MTSPAGTTSRPPFAAGLLVALLSAAAFGSSGAFAKSLLEAGWSPAAVVTLRVAGGAVLLLPFAVRALRGRWDLLRRHASTVLIYGLVAVAGCQLAYFSAVRELSVAMALLLEYLAPVIIVGWAWARHGRRPSRLTTAGVVAALVGLALVLEVTSGIRVSLLGVGYGLLAAVGLVVFFLLSDSEDEDPLPPITLAGAGLTIGAVALGLAGMTGLLPLAATSADVALAGVTLPWWVPLAELVVVAAALAYATGVIAVRALGATVASFVGLVEVLFAIVFAALLLGEVPGPVQLLGGLGILGGVVAVKLGEAKGADALEPRAADLEGPAELAGARLAASSRVD